MSKYSPKQLFLEFSNNYCDNTTTWGTRTLSWGKGSAYDFEGMTKLLKKLPYPCFSNYLSQISSSTNDKYKKRFGDFVNSGNNKLALPYKFLQIIDPDAFKEIQQSPYASVAHALRNAADLSRACYIFWESRSKTTPEMFYTWEARGATEPTFYYAGNSLAKSLLFNGINYVKITDSENRANGCDDLSCMPSLLSAKYRCICPSEETGLGDPCPPAKKNCKVPLECEKKSCVQRAKCAEEVFPNSGDYRYPESIAYYNGNQFINLNGSDWELMSDSNKDEYVFRTSHLHAGYFVRKSYGGYGNFTSNGDFFGTQDSTILLKYIQLNNSFNYKTSFYDIDISEKNIYKTDKKNPNKPKIDRIKNASLLTNTSQVRDCLYNGYGVLISTNVGFSDRRNSIGISYPDRLWYHTMAIIGYDDTKTIYPECLYLFANSWGKWNYGGEPPWGPIPEGSFLVTESHLSCIMNSWPRVDKFKDCNPLRLRTCLPYYPEDGTINWVVPQTSIAELFITDFKDRTDDRAQNRRWVRYTCNNVKVLHTSEKQCNRRLKEELKESSNCGDSCVDMDDCDYIGCSANQSPWGMTFAISFDEDIPFMRKEMGYNQFFVYR